jgi:hypothetical protein
MEQLGTAGYSIHHFPLFSLLNHQTGVFHMAIKMKKLGKSKPSEKEDKKVSKAERLEKQAKADAKEAKVLKAERLEKKSKKAAKEEKLSKSERKAQIKAEEKKSKKLGKAGKEKKVKKSKRVKEVEVVKPIKEKIKKNDLIELLMEKCDLDKNQTKSVIAALETIIKGSLVKKSCGEFNFQGLFKLRTKDVPAQKGGVKKKNPFKPGEMMVTKAKPASVKVKAAALGKLKKIVIGE